MDSVPWNCVIGFTALTLTGAGIGGYVGKVLDDQDNTQKIIDGDSCEDTPLWKRRLFHGIVLGGVSGGTTGWGLSKLFFH